MPTNCYQTHENGPRGMSDSGKKLERLMLPDDLTGMRVLDIGCNEGFFCNEAAKRGAANVVGIDGHRPFLDVAEQRYSASNIKFIQQRWHDLPDGPFDLVLWTSAMHYELDPAKIFERISAILAPDALFILECGVLPWPSKEMVLYARHEDSRWYPTRPLLMEMLSRFACRQVIPAEHTVGDPVPRAVFHCNPRKTVVVLVRGDTRQGKTSLASLLTQSVTKTVSLDGLVTRIAIGKYHHTELQKFVRDKYDSKNLGKIYYGIDESGLTEQYARLIAETIVASDKLVVIEGLLTDPQAEAISARLKNKALVWDVHRR